MIKRIRVITEKIIYDEQYGFRKGRERVDQVFTVRQVCGKYLVKGKDVFWTVMDLDKACDLVDSEGSWIVLRLYGISGRLLNGINNRAFVKVGNSWSDCFSVRLVLHVYFRLGCLIFI